MTDLEIDPERYESLGDDGAHTGIYVRAKHVHNTENAVAGKHASVDIAVLTKDSVLTWLRSRGGENAWAEDVVGHLLGYGAFTDEDS